MLGAFIMRTPIRWTEKLARGNIKQVEVRFSGKNKITWKIEIITQTEVLLNDTPSAEDWHNLLAIAEKWYIRRRIPYKYFACICKLSKSILYQNIF